MKINYKIIFGNRRQQRDNAKIEAKYVSKTESDNVVYSIIVLLKVEY